MSQYKKENISVFYFENLCYKIYGGFLGSVKLDLYGCCYIIFYNIDIE